MTPQQAMAFINMTIESFEYQKIYDPENYIPDLPEALKVINRLATKQMASELAKNINVKIPGVVIEGKLM